MRKALILLVAVAAAVGAWLLMTLPPLPVQSAGSVDPDLQRRTIAGAVHVHSSRSDGAATKSDIAAAAARAGLRFVIFTEHGDGSVPPDPPLYLHGVLCIDGVEISTTDGHYVAVGLPVAPYRLGGEPSAVAEDVKRLGGFGIVAHPGSTRPALAWNHWAVDIDGLEWLNLDSEWRDEPSPELVRAVLQYPLRSAAAIASLLDRPATELARWDMLSRSKRIVSLAGHDAHGALGGRHEGGRWMGLRGVPSYEAVFRVFAVRAIVRTGLEGQAAVDADRVVDAVRSGRVFTAIDAVAAPAFIDFHAQRGPTTVEMGGWLPEPGHTTLVVRAAMPSGARVVLLRDGVEVKSAGGEVSYESDVPGAYRVEVEVGGSVGSPPVPWIVSNPIYVGLPSPAPPLPVSPRELVALMSVDWRSESDPGSSGAVTREGEQVRFRYSLRAGAEESQFAALSGPLPDGLPDYNAVVLDLGSSRPARLSVQLRFPDGQRWIRSAWVSPESRRIVIRADDLVPAEPSSGRRHPDLREAASLLLVFDLTNNHPGSAGELVVRSAFLANLN